MRNPSVLVKMLRDVDSYLLYQISVYIVNKCRKGKKHLDYIYSEHIFILDEFLLMMIGIKRKKHYSTIHYTQIWLVSFQKNASNRDCISCLFCSRHGFTPTMASITFQFSGYMCQLIFISFRVP